MSEQPKHRQNDEFPAFCTCLSRWPCDFALEQALARIADLERALAVADATIAELTGHRDRVQAGWNEDRRLSEEAIDAHMARWKRAEAALAAAERREDVADNKLTASEQRAARLVEAGDAMADAIAGLLIVGSVSWRAGAIAMSDWGVARAALAGSTVACCNNCGMRHAPDDTAACIEGHGEA